MSELLLVMRRQTFPIKLMTKKTGMAAECRSVFLGNIELNPYILNIIYFNNIINEQFCLIFSYMTRINK